MSKKIKPVSKRAFLNEIFKLSKKNNKTKFSLPSKTYEQVSNGISYESLVNISIKKEG